MSLRERRLLTALMLIWCSFYTYLPHLSPYSREIGASLSMVGLISGAYGFSQILVRIPLGIWSDITGKQKPFIIAGSVFAMLSGLLIYLFPSPAMLLAGRFIAGLGAATWVNFTVLFSSYYPPQEAPKAVGILSGAVRAGMFIAILSSAIITLWWPTHTLFLIAAVFAGLGLLAASRTIDIEQEKGRFNWQGLGNILRSPSFIIFSLLALINQAIVYGTTFGFTPLIAKRLGATAMGLSIASLLHLLPQIIFAPYASGKLLRERGEKFVLLVGFLLTILSNLATPWVPSLFWFYIIQIVTGIANSMTFVIISGLVIKDVPFYLRSAATGVFQSIFSIGMMAGPVISGFLADHLGLNSVYYVLSIPAILAMITISIFTKKKEQTHEL